MSFFVILIIVGVIIYVFLSRTVLKITFQPCYSHIKGFKTYSLTLDSFYNVFNPSISRTIVSDNTNTENYNNFDYVCCARLSTFSQKNLLEYIYASLFHYDSRLVFVEFKNGKTKKIIYPHIETEGGLEDPRMIVYGNYYLISASEYIKKKNYNFPVLLLFDSNYNFIKRIEYNRDDYFGEKKHSVQKNWCPFVKEDKILLHTDAFPIWKVYSVDENGNMNKEIEKNIEKALDEATKKGKWYIRCSTSWKDYDNENYICGLHLKTKGRMPCIRSMLVLMNKESLLPVYRSDLFCLGDDHNRIQYLSGLETDKNDILLAYGLDDCSINIKRISKSNLKFRELVY